MKRNIDDFIDFCESISLGQGKGMQFNMAGLVTVAEKVTEEYKNINKVNHQGHLRTSFYLVYDFFIKHGAYAKEDKYLGIPFDNNLRSSKEFIIDMSNFLSDETNNCEEYQVNRVVRNIPLTLGGSATDGGRWSPQYKTVIPLVKAYILKNK